MQGARAVRFRPSHKDLRGGEEVSRQAHNLEVAGSIPALATKTIKALVS